MKSIAHMGSLFTLLASYAALSLGCGRGRQALEGTAEFKSSEPRVIVLQRLKISDSEVSEYFSLQTGTVLHWQAEATRTGWTLKFKTGSGPQALSFDFTGKLEDLIKDADGHLYLSPQTTGWDHGVFADFSITFPSGATRDYRVPSENCEAYRRHRSASGERVAVPGKKFRRRRERHLTPTLHPSNPPAAEAQEHAEGDVLTEDNLSRTPDGVVRMLIDLELEGVGRNGREAELWGDCIPIDKL